MNREVELQEKLKLHQFIETDKDFIKILSFTSYVGKNDDLKVFWYCLKLWFKREEICNILGISTPTYYALDKYILLNINKNVSEKLVNRVELLYSILRWYVTWEEKN